MLNRTIGFVGVGRMGSPMARRLLDAGYKVIVADHSAEAVSELVAAGAMQAKSPAEIASKADVIMLSLPTPDIVLAVAFGENGLTGQAGDGKIVIDLSTTGPEGARKLAAGLHEHGFRPLDCPVSGGIGGAKAGTLALMASGEKAIFDDVLDILGHLGNAFHVGPEPWMGQMVKVLNNLVSITALSITSEVLVLGSKAGLDPKVMVDVINVSSGQSNASLTKIPKFVLPRTFDFGFALGLSAKDVRLCIEQSHALGTPMVIGSSVLEMLKISLAQLGHDADLTEVIRPMEQWAGVKVGKDSDPT